MRKTKIICTLGPAVDSEDMIRTLIRSGMDAARINFSHGSHEEHKQRIDRVKAVREEYNLPIALLLDTKGPEIRTGDMQDGKIFLKKGEQIRLTPRACLGTPSKISITYPDLYQDVQAGTSILIDDGLIELRVEQTQEQDILCRVLNDGAVSNHKGINVPDVHLSIPYLSDKDKSDIQFGIEQGVDFIAASFVRTADDVQQLRMLLDENGGAHINIIAKIENQQGVENIDGIVSLADGVMIARGDMGVEVPFDHLPAIQKNIIKTCYKKGRIVITATQMLDSMQEHPRPTRAEVSDVANAIYDGTTAIMLSGETAAGKYPVEAVQAMSRIAEYTENQINYQERYLKNNLNLKRDILNTITSASVEASFFLAAKAIVVGTVTGYTAHVASFYRPAVPIIASCTDRKATKQLKLDYGVYPYHCELTDDRDVMRSQALQIARDSKVVSKGDLVVMIFGSLGSGKSTSDTMIIAEA